jgi:hypothetical protein
MADIISVIACVALARTAVASATRWLAGTSGGAA